MASATDSIGVHARLEPDRPAAADLTTGQRWSYGELDELVARLAAELERRGCEPGDRVASLARNSVFLVALHFAAARAGLIYAPLNWRLGAAELLPLIDLAEPTLLVADAISRATLEACGRPSVALDELIECAARLEEPPNACAPPGATADRPSLLLFTSGTSGRPKGVILTERNLRETAINFGMLTRVDGASRFLCDSPMFHVIGIVTNVRPALLHGGSIVVSDGFNAARTLARLGDPVLGVTHYVGVPQMLEALRREPGFEPAPLRHLRALVSGGAPHAHSDLRAWLADGVPLVLGFGMSETGTVFGMSTDLGTIARKLGSVGIAAPGVETRLVSRDGEEVAAGEAGELLIRGDNVSPSYWRDPQATAASRDAAGWFATGDIARCDADGFFWIVDRRKDMFISGGENVYPAEIESVLVAYPGIAYCAVVGVPHARWGEVGHLAIVELPDATVVPADLLGFLAERLARYKVPKYVSVLAEMPRTATGKIQKGALRDLLRGPATPA
jgi:fatty-acyl-CoA synthase